MADNTLDHLVLRSSSVVSLNDRFSKLEPPVEDLCLDVEVRTVQPRKNRPPQRLTRVAPPGAQRGGGPGASLSSTALEDRFLGARRCPCALWGLRLFSRRYGWARKVLRPRPIRRAGLTPDHWKAQFRRKAPSKEVLDRQLDDYMALSKRHLDAQLDAYMAGDRDAGDDDDRKLYDSDCAE